MTIICCGGHWTIIRDDLLCPMLFIGQEEPLRKIGCANSVTAREVNRLPEKLSSCKVVKRQILQNKQPFSIYN